MFIPFSVSSVLTAEDSVSIFSSDPVSVCSFCVSAESSSDGLLRFIIARAAVIASNQTTLPVAINVYRHIAHIHALGNKIKVTVPGAPYTYLVSGTHFHNSYSMYRNFCAILMFAFFMPKPYLLNSMYNSHNPIFP